MSNLEMGVQLPSLGKPYANYPALSKTIVLRMISARQEKKIYGSSNVPYSLNELLKECIVSPEVPVDFLTVEDKYFLLAKLRIHSYGDILHSYGTCTCGFRGEVEFSLDDVIVNNLEGEYNDVFEIKLPVSGDTVKVRVLRNGDFTKITDRTKMLQERVNLDPEEQSYITTMAMSIVSVNGDDTLQIQQKEDYVSNLYGKDTMLIRAVQSKYSYGYESVGTATCPKCKSKITVPVGLNFEFFHPRLD